MNPQEPSTKATATEYEPIERPAYEPILHGTLSAAKFATTIRPSPPLVSMSPKLAYVAPITKYVVSRSEPWIY